MNSLCRFSVPLSRTGQVREHLLAWTRFSHRSSRQNRAVRSGAIATYALYAERNLIERFFKFIKQFRGIATRYEKTARNFLAAVHLACALAWLK